MRLRIGFDSRMLEFHDPAAELQSVLSSLISGASLPQLKRRAHRVGLPESELQELLRFIDPVLLRVHSPHPRRSQKYATSIRSHTVVQPLPISLAFDFQAPPSRSYSESAAEAFEFFNFTVDQSEQAEAQDHPLVFFARFFPSFGFLNREVFGERFALPVVFSDGGVRVGPLLGQPFGCCIDCLSAFETSIDADWPAMVAAQLGTVAPSETEQVFRQIPPLVQLVINEARQATAGHSFQQHNPLRKFTQWFLPVKDGLVTAEASRRQVKVRESCPCTTLELHSNNDSEKANTATKTREFDAA